MGNLLNSPKTQNLHVYNDRNVHFSLNSRSGASGRSTSAAEVLQELFAELPIPCVRCKDSMANTRLLPCKHKVLCVDCSFKCRVCPLCNVPVANRCDLREYYFNMNHCLFGLLFLLNSMKRILNRDLESLI